MYIGAEANGDDWLYLEDTRTSSSKTSCAEGKSPLTMTQMSSTGAELLALEYNKQPKHRKLHDGHCNFSGVTDPATGTKQSHRTQDL